MDKAQCTGQREAGARLNPNSSRRIEGFAQRRQDILLTPRREALSVAWVAVRFNPRGRYSGVYLCAARASPGGEPPRSVEVLTMCVQQGRIYKIYIQPEKKRGEALLWYTIGDTNSLLWQNHPCCMCTSGWRRGYEPTSHGSSPHLGPRGNSAMHDAKCTVQKARARATTSPRQRTDVSGTTKTSRISTST